MASGKTALVTGATSGIGFSFAKLLAKKGYDLFIVGHNAARMEKTASDLRATYCVQVTPIIQDLSLADSTKKVMEHVNTPLDILINAAGFGLYGMFSETDIQKERDMVHVNIVALMELTKLALPGMIAKRNGKILNIASIAAFQPGPRMAVYYASKAYVLSFSQAVAEEIKHTGVTITTLCPGPTKTHFEDAAQLEHSHLFKEKHLLSPEYVAHAGYTAMIQGRRMVIPGFKHAIRAWATRFVPIAFAARVANYVQRPLKK